LDVDGVTKFTGDGCVAVERCTVSEREGVGAKRHAGGEEREKEANRDKASERGGEAEDLLGAVVGPGFDDGRGNGARKETSQTRGRGETAAA